MRISPFMFFLSMLVAGTVTVMAQCPRETDTLQYFDPNGTTVVFQMPLPTPWWGVLNTPDFATRLDSVFVGFGITRAIGTNFIDDTLQFRVLENTLPTVTTLHTGQFILPGSFTGTVDDDFYLIDYSFLGTYPFINPARDFWYSWRLKGPSTHSGHVLLRKPALNPSRSVVIGPTGATMTASEYVSWQIPDSVDLWLETRPCYYNGVPVELAAFDAEYTGRDVLLTWTTASETDNMGFAIERAIPSIDSDALLWQKIGFVSGNGTSTAEHRYTFEDPAPVQMADRHGVLRYRLRQVDFDGSFHLTPVREVRIPTSFNGFALHPSHPNPAMTSGNVIVSFTVPVETGLVIGLVDAAGRSVRTLFDGTHPAGAGSLTMSTDGLVPGGYFVVLSSGSTRLSQRLVVTR